MTPRPVSIGWVGKLTLSLPLPGWLGMGMISTSPVKIV